MARVAGRNLAMSWIVGVLCAAVVAGLLWVAAPILPTVATVAGTLLRGILP